MASKARDEVLHVVEDLFQDEKKRKAIVQLEQLAEEYPDDRDVLIYLGVAYLAVDKTEEALGIMRKAYIGNANSVKNEEKLRQVCGHLQVDADKAVAELSPAMNGNWFARVERAAEAGDWKSAMSEALQWTEQEPDNARAWNAAAITAWKMGRKEQAIGFVQHSKQLAPEDEVVRKNGENIMATLKKGDNQSGEKRLTLSSNENKDGNDKSVANQRDVDFGDIVPPSTCAKKYEDNVSSEDRAQVRELNSSLINGAWEKAMQVMRSMTENRDVLDIMKSLVSGRDSEKLIKLGEYCRLLSLHSTAIIAFSLAAKLARPEDDLETFCNSEGAPYREVDVRCDVCDAEPNLHTVSILDKGYTGGLLNPVRCWHKCPECGLVYANPRPTEAVLDCYYEQMVEDTNQIQRQLKRAENMVQMAAGRAAKIADMEPPGESVLDVGGGIGLFGSVCEDFAFNSTVLDICNSTCNFAAKKFGLEIRQENFLNANINKKYDIITGWEVLEHVSSPLKMTKHVSSCLKRDGLWCFATPVYDNTIGKLSGLRSLWYKEVGHLYYFSKASLNTMVQKCGMKIECTRPSEEGLGRQEFYARKV